MNAKIHNLLSSLKTIAQFPITNPKENMDAANMARIAANALEEYKKEVKEKKEKHEQRF